MGEKWRVNGNNKPHWTEWNEDIINQNMWDTTKVGLRKKLTPLIAYIRKWERSQIKNLSPYLKKLEKEEEN